MKTLVPILLIRSAAVSMETEEAMERNDDAFLMRRMGGGCRQE
jgi:hypothetical protein